MMIHAGDCLEWLASMADASADHCISDAPYSEHVHSKSLRSGDRNARQAKAHGRTRKPSGQPRKRDLGFASLTPQLMDDVACELARVVKRWVAIFANVELAPAWWWALQGAGLDYVRTCVWVKPNAAPQFTGDRPSAGWEAVVLAHRKGRKKWNGGGRSGVFVHPIETGHYGRERVHSTEKPLPLMLEMIELFTDPGDLVIDPFAGSGSTGVACLRRGRLFAGAEIDEAMAHLANERLAAEGEDSTLRDRRAGQLSLRSGSAVTS